MLISAAPQQKEQEKQQQQKNRKNVRPFAFFLFILLPAFALIDFFSCHAVSSLIKT
jgi:hypothetical protein